MSRSGYVDDFDDAWQLIKWRGQQILQTTIPVANCGL